MSDKSAIEWTDATWNPIRARNLATGKIGWHCEHATTGCEFCYAESMNKRLGTGLPFKPGHRKGIEIFLDEEMLLAPLRWRKPRMIFPCSMTDMFAPFVKDEWLDKMFAVMALCADIDRKHIFQILTKRFDRMRAYIESKRENAPEWIHLPSEGGKVLLPYEGGVPNYIWLGVSCERQQEADERIPHLLQTPAAVRFVSAEPLLEPIKFHEVLGDDWLASGKSGERRGLDWVIVGGESGPRAREHDLQWSRDLIAQCTASGVAVFVKQLGANVVGPHANGVNQTTYKFKHSKGGDWSQWPTDLRVREFPKTESASVIEDSVPQHGMSSPDPNQKEATRS